MYPLGYSMRSTHCFAHFAVLSFEFFLIGNYQQDYGQRLIFLAHQTTRLPFSLAQEQNLQAPVNQTWVFFPALMAT